MKRCAVMMAALGLLVVMAPAAHAIAVPFGTSHTIDGQNVTVPGQSGDTGLIGICDNAGLNCTGLRVVEATSDAPVSTTSTTLTLRGWVCVSHPAPPCSTNNVPFTGVRITERVIDLPEASAYVAAMVDVCIWVMAPEGDPTSCIPALPAIDGFSTPDTGNLGDAIPDSVDLTFVN